MFGASRAHGKSGTGATNVTNAFTALAGSIADALSPRQINPAIEGASRFT